MTTLDNNVEKFISILKNGHDDKRIDLTLVIYFI